MGGVPTGACGLESLLPNGSFAELATPDGPAQQTLLERVRAEDIKWWDADACTYTGAIAREWVGFQKRITNAAASLPQDDAADGSASLTVCGCGQQCGVIADVLLPEKRARYRLSSEYRANRDGVRGMTGWLFYRV